MIKHRKIKFGIALIILSGIAFASVILIPLMDIENEIKIIGSSSAFIIMEILFWAGSLLIGKELYNKYKSYLNPKTWWRSNDKTIKS